MNILIRFAYAVKKSMVLRNRKRVKPSLISIAVSITLFIFVQSSLVYAQISFSDLTSVYTGDNPYFVAAGDINGDGIMDLAVINYSDQNISVLLNTTTPGTLIPSFSKTDIATDTHPWSIDIGDLNSDGKPDLVVAIPDSDKVNVFLNTTIPGSLSPSFTGQTKFTTGGMPYWASIGDVNGDGMPDLASANYGSNSVSVLLNTTTPGAYLPSFSDQTDFEINSNGIYISLNDLNSDGKQDMIVSNWHSGSVSVFLNTTMPGAATPSFTDRTDFATGARPRGFDIDDLDGDGKPDLAVTDYLSNEVSVLLNTTLPGSLTPSFSDKTNFIAGDRTFHIALGDLDGDGKPDMAVTNIYINTVSIFLNTTTPGASTPSFSLVADYITGVLPSGIVLVDLNGDSKLDLITANQYSYDISVRMNTTYIPIPPTIICPDNITVNNDPDQCSAVVPFTAIATGEPAPQVEYKIGDTPISSPYTFPVGTTTVTCTATNTAGSATCSFDVTVLDIQEPTITVSLTPTTLWAPDKTMRSITATVAVQDNCPSCASYVLTSITSNEELDGDDIQNAIFNTPDTQFDLRAKRSGNNMDGRIYTVTYTASDCSGNNTEVISTVIVPHDQGNYKENIFSKRVTIPDHMELGQNYPNPFNPTTTISFALPADAEVNLVVYNTMGQEVAQLVKGFMSAGYHDVVFDASQLPSGVYYYRMQAGEYVAIKKLLVLK